MRQQFGCGHGYAATHAVAQQMKFVYIKVLAQCKEYFTPLLSCHRILFRMTKIQAALAMLKEADANQALVRQKQCFKFPEVLPRPSESMEAENGFMAGTYYMVLNLGLMKMKECHLVKCIARQAAPGKD